VDWEKVIFKLLSSNFPDFRLTVWHIDLCPVDYGLKILEYLTEKEGEQYNYQSFTSAVGWASLTNGFGGNISYTDLLPIKTEQSQLKQGLNKPTEHTLKVLQQLLLQKRLPRRMVLALGGVGVLNEVEKLK